MLGGQRLANARVGPAIVVAPHQEIPIHPVGGQFIGGKVHAVAVEILVDIAEEVRQLESLAQGLRRRLGIAERSDGAEDGQHL